MPTQRRHATHTLSSAYLREVLAAMEIDTPTATQWLAEVGIAQALLQQPAARITDQQFARLYRLIAVRCDDEMPRLFSRPLRPGALKFTCLALLDSRNLETALHRWTNVLRLLQDDFRLEVTRDGPHARIAMAEDAAHPPCKPMALDLMLKLIHGVTSWLIGRRIPLVRVDFSFRPPASAAEFETLYPGPVVYGTPQSALHLEARVLDQPIRRTRADLPEFLRRAPQDWLFVPFTESRLEPRLRDYIASRLPDTATGEGAADALHLSLRTLHRHLAAEGTSLQRVKDQLRRDLAIQRLTGSHDALADIAAQLGFDGPASFHRAFKAWTGSTPGAYRTPPHA